MWTKENIGDQAGKTVIVTGANTGIGYETALALYEAGVMRRTRKCACGRTAEKGHWKQECWIWPTAMQSGHLPQHLCKTTTGWTF